MLTSPCEQAAAQAVSPTTVVLADPRDPYYPLAEEIAKTEGIPLFHSLTNALDENPTYLLWVVSPPFLSDSALIAMGRAQLKQPVAVGLIAASTHEQARDLWLRAKEVKGEVFVAANAANPSGNIEPKMLIWEAGQTTSVALNSENLRYYLQNADYLTFTGHGSSRYWRLDQETSLVAADLPHLPPIVIQSGSCNSFRIWERDSLALAFIDQGAAAYVGFAYSPNEGYLFGEFEGLPFRYSYPEFPVGVIVQLQNRGTLQGFAALPFLFLLGDPRLSHQTKPPYQLVEDYVEKSSRTLVYHQLPEGVVPIWIKGGASYSYVKATGISSASTTDPFYNSRIQMLDMGEDKFLLILTKDGKLTLQLSRQPPWHWQVTDRLTDSLDFSLIFLPQSNVDWLSAVLALFPCAWVLLQMRRKNLKREFVWQAVLIGGAGFLLQAGYACLRLNSVSITSKVVKINFLALALNGFLAASGAWLICASRNAIEKWAGILVLLFPLWLPLLYSGLVQAGFNRLVAIPRLGIPLYNGHSVHQIFIALMFVGGIYALLFKSVKRKPNS